MAFTSSNLGVFGSSLLGGGFSNLFNRVDPQQIGRPAPLGQNIVPLDTSVIANTVTFQELRQANAPERPEGPDVVPPWLRNPDQPELNSRIREARSLTSFIDRDAPGVESVGNTADSRSSFIIFDALTKLQTLAEFAAADSTPRASLARLDAQFRAGLEEVRSFIAGADTDKLTFLTGERTSRVTADVDFGKDTRSFTGRAVATESRDDPLAGIDGTETFTLSIAKDGGESREIQVDLSQIVGDISINAVVDLVNQQIEAQDITFVSRLSVSTNGDFDHAIRIDSGKLETVTLSAGAPETALFVAENTVDPLDDEAAASALRQFGGGSVDIAEIRSTDLTAGDPGAASDSTATRSAAAVTDSQGFTFTIGATAGGFGNQVNTSEDGQDVFLTKTDSAGNVVFSRLLGAGQSAEGFGLTLDSADNVIVSGQTTDNLDTDARVSGTDSFVTKFDNQGRELFTFQLDTFATDSAASVAVDANGDILVTGQTSGAVDASTPNIGGRDTLVMRIDGETGQRTDTAVLGTAAGQEEGRGIALAQDGNVLVVAREGDRAVLRKLDSANLSNVLFERDLGGIGGTGQISALRVDGDGIFIGGSTEEAGFDGGAAVVAAPQAGGLDGFVLRLTDTGLDVTSDFISFLGSGKADRVQDLQLSGGDVFLAGDTRGNLGDATLRGIQDGFVARLDAASGQIEEIEQFGTFLRETSASALALTDRGPGVLDALGLPSGDLSRIESRDIFTQTSARAGDFFELSINDGARRRIEIEQGDTLQDLVDRINRLSPVRREISASIEEGSLTIRAEGRNTLEFFAGSDGRDLLARFGLQPTRVLGPTALFDLDSEESVTSRVGGVFAFNLDQSLNLADRDAAKQALSRITDAIEVPKRAFRSLSPPPDLSGLQQPEGTVPTRLRNQLANYQDGLQRIQAFNQGGGFGGGGIAGGGFFA